MDLPPLDRVCAGFRGSMAPFEARLEDSRRAPSDLIRTVEVTLCPQGPRGRTLDPPNATHPGYPPAPRTQFHGINRAIRAGLCPSFTLCALVALFSF